MCIVYEDICYFCLDWIFSCIYWNILHLQWLAWKGNKRSAGRGGLHLVSQYSLSRWQNEIDSHELFPWSWNRDVRSALYVCIFFFLILFLFREQKVGKNVFFFFLSWIWQGFCLFSFGELYFTYKPFNV